ncbi:MAG: prolipoprotein diacylglyceryl transferase [Humidesulfovibrio sp.]|uniref:prolipoprotein diacylglyceryl transferase n=1 Tax=Humidesulfovibrio sp. TaxID=2910988 RepID=UPI002732A4DB|nr:prolipoprotein diacylglyceryl transferase [Humidesulfovibrio sp.]MDP2848234.1 prolipoprotein diacylglyceryl transferase [Humidesulfovibrio sp.]
MLTYPVIDPVALQIGPLAARWYGLMYAVGFASAWWLGRVRAAKPGSGWTALQVDDLITWMVAGVVLGGRLGYVLFYDPAYYLANPLESLSIWRGGMSFHGGVAGVVLVCWLYGRSIGKSLLEVGDLVAPLVPPGLLAGRMGNFINGELWGRVTDVPWAMVFPTGGPLPRHPSQLYEAALEGLALFVILWAYAAKPRQRGAVGGLFLLGYGGFRFFVEFFRQPDVQLGLVALDFFSMGQLLCLPMIFAGLYLMLRKPTVSPGKPARA